MNDSYVVIETVYGRVQAEILRGMLEAAGIHAQLAQESAGTAIGLGVGPLGAVRLSVPSKHADAARDLLQAYYDGDLDPGPDANPARGSSSGPD